MRRGNATVFDIAPLTMAFLGINIALFVYTAILSKTAARIDYDVLLGMGMSLRERLWEGEWVRLVAPMFLHGGILHIVFNVMSLKSMGPAAEVHFGSANFGTIYLLGGVGGIAFSQIFGGYPSVGASTSVFAVMGAWLAVKIHAAPVLKNAWRNSEVREVAFYIGLNLIVGIVGLFGNIDNWGHFGGLVVGLLLGFTFEHWRSRQRLQISVALVILLAVGSMVAAARWSVFSPWYHAHKSLIAGIEKKDNAEFQREWKEAERWAKVWGKERQIKDLKIWISLGYFNLETARTRGYKYAMLLSDLNRNFLDSDKVPPGPPHSPDLSDPP